MIAAGASLVDRALIAYARGPEHPSKIRAIHWLIRRVRGGKMRVRYAARATIAIDPSDYIGWAILRTGSYEPASLDLALRIVSALPGLFVDVGANFGWYSCAIAAIPGASVVAIEADCANCASLRANLCGLANAVVINGAAGAGFDAVRISRIARGNSGTVAVAAAAANGHDRTWIATAPLDQWLRRVVDPPVRPVLIKLDVEGFEPQVLSGIDFDGSFRPRNIIMEYEPALAERAWNSFTAMRDFFTQRGYDLFDVFGRPLAQPGDLPEANIWARER
jgi:FkbM family methyltransferase